MDKYRRYLGYEFEDVIDNIDKDIFFKGKRVKEAVKELLSLLQNKYENIHSVAQFMESAKEGGLVIKNKILW